MLNSDNQNQKITFLENASPIISELLERYQLQETPDELFKKLTKGEVSRGGIILDIVIEVAQGKISKKNLVPSIQKYLNIPKEEAKKLAEDIEKRLLVLVKKVPKEEMEIKPPIPSGRPSVAKNPPITEKSPITEKPKTAPKKQKTTKEADVYREPVE